jgi:hypothetical protein
LIQGKTFAADPAPNGLVAAMVLALEGGMLRELFSSDVGQLSLAVLVVTLGIGVFYLRYFLKHIKDDAEKSSSRGNP